MRYGFGYGAGLLTSAPAATPPPALTLVSLVTNAAGTEIIGTVSGTLDGGSVPDAGDFALTGTSSAPTGTVTIDGSTFTVPLDVAVLLSDDITLDYTPGSNPLVSALGAELGALDDEPVTNAFVWTPNSITTATKLAWHRASVVTLGTGSEIATMPNQFSDHAEWNMAAGASPPDQVVGGAPDGSDCIHFNAGDTLVSGTLSMSGDRWICSIMKWDAASGATEIVYEANGTSYRFFQRTGPMIRFQTGNVDADSASPLADANFTDWGTWECNHDVVGTESCIRNGTTIASASTNTTATATSMSYGRATSGAAHSLIERIILTGPPTGADLANLREYCLRLRS